MSLFDDAVQANQIAVITGAASGIGLETARALAQRGMNLVLADNDLEALQRVCKDAFSPLSELPAERLLTLEVDVSDAGQVNDLKTAAYERFGQVNFLMNNAGIVLPAQTWTDAAAWQRILEVNLFGVINGVQAFSQAMLDQGSPGLIVNTGSKQGITCPPGNAAYNTSKAAVKALTESLAHSLRTVENSQVSAHLLIPGFVYTGMVAKFLPEKPDLAWTPEETVEFMLEKLAAGDFYILCPDNETPTEMDHKRIRWGAGDIVENRPALSRWHPDYTDAFAQYMDD